MSIIASINDNFATVAQKIYAGIVLSEGDKEAVDSYDYDNAHRFTYRRLEDGIVYVACTIYGDGVEFRFEAEYAMLYPVSLQFCLIALNPKNEEMIYYVWDGAYYESFGEYFEELRADAASNASTFTEDEISRAAQALKEFWNHWRRLKPEIQIKWTLDCYWLSSVQNFQPSIKLISLS